MYFINDKIETELRPESSQTTRLRPNSFAVASSASYEPYGRSLGDVDVGDNQALSSSANRRGKQVL